MMFNATHKYEHVKGTYIIQFLTQVFKIIDYEKKAETINKKV